MKHLSRMQTKQLSERIMQVTQSGFYALANILLSQNTCDMYAVSMDHPCMM